MPLRVRICKQEIWQFPVPITRGFGGYIVPENCGVKRGIFAPGADNGQLWEQRQRIFIMRRGFNSAQLNKAV